MSGNHGTGSNVHASSTGQSLTSVAWLDVHFEACQPEYEAMARSVGFQSGWRVLDAGCGSGSFLPLLAELVGPTGSLVALDLAEDNVAAVLDRAAPWQFPCLLEARVGDVTALPFPDDHFDAVWFAATSQYLTGDELVTTLAEFRRVVRPGGIVALKDYDATVPRFLPAPANSVTHLCEAVAHSGVTQYMGILRTPALGMWLRRAGLNDVWTRTTLVERSAPLGPPERQLWGDGFTYFASLALGQALLADEREMWERLANPSERARLLDDPDFYCCEGHVVAVGRVPDGG